MLIALGGNLPGELGPPEHTLRAGLAALGDSGVQVRRVSRFFATPCFPAGAGPDYVNAAAELAECGSPAELLAVLHKIEAAFGRARGERWGQRTLDLDLIAHGDTVLPDPATYEAWRTLSPATQRRAAPDQLILPHPRLQDRAFVLVPLLDVAPEWIHPVLGQTVRQMADALPGSEKSGVIPL